MFCKRLNHLKMFLMFTGKAHVRVRQDVREALELFVLAKKTE